MVSKKTIVIIICVALIGLRIVAGFVGIYLHKNDTPKNSRFPARLCYDLVF